VLPAALREPPLAAGRYACTLHVGPYEQLGDVWARFLGEWLPKKSDTNQARRQFRALSERSDPGAKHQLRTEIYQPIA
jgi:AraC family transcriptional regulator